MYWLTVPSRLIFSVALGLFLASIAPPGKAATADHLIITEILVKTRAPVTTFGSPFIEIHNPTGAAIPMDNVYLTDGTTAPATYYFKITLVDPDEANPGGGIGGDFHARFPAGFTLAAGDTIAIAINGSEEYQTAYGRKPDFELYEDGTFPDDVPELWEAFPGSIGAGLGGTGNVPILSDLAESLVLYSWDGSSDLVQDLDYVFWGTNTSVRFDKTGVTVGGATYLADTPVASQQPAAAAGPSYGEAFRRPDSDEGTETTSGGNGITGDDETSENLATTFPTVTGQEPPLANPPFPAGPIVTAGGITPVAPVDGQPVVLWVTAVDQDEVESAVFYYSINGGPYKDVVGAHLGPEEWSITVPAQVENTVVSWYAVVVNTESTEAIHPPGSPNFAFEFTVGPSVIPGDAPAKLLLTEISTTGAEQEYIEIYNPGTEAVDMSDYYITDANYSPSNQHYYRIGEGNPTQATVGGGDFNDFHARFPDGFTIAAGDTIVMTVAGSIAFVSNFGVGPDLELWEDDASPDGVPDMRWIFGTAGDNSIISPGYIPSLTNGAETVILYNFVTGQDKVTDIDVFVWQDPSSTTTSQYFNKTGVTVGTHSYLDENGTNLAYAFGTQNEFGNSYHRTDATEGGQTPSGSNGVDGRDETSENFNNTFAMMPYDPALAPIFLPAADKLLLTEIHAGDSGAEFIEIYNPGAVPVDLGRYFLTDAVDAPSDKVYWHISIGTPTEATVGGGSFEDFHAKFPDGFTLAAGDTITVALQGSQSFETAFGTLPHFEMYEDNPLPDQIPDMVYVFGNDIDNSIINRTGGGSGQPSTPNLTNAAETVVLYHWIEGADGVTDVDVFFWQDAITPDKDFLFDKTGVTVGSHSYLPDTDVSIQTPFPSEAPPGFSYQRTDPSEGTQALTGSNGVGGRDETSENLYSTFQMIPADPTGSPLPGPSPDKLLLTEISTVSTAQEYIEIHNPGAEEVDLSDYYLTDAVYSTGNQVYWRIAEGNPSTSTVGGGAYYDFHARFPAGFTIAPGDTIVITVPGSDDFMLSFGFLPDLELFEDGITADEIPDMRWIFGDSINNSIINRTGNSSGQPSNPGLTNGGETVILYHWLEGEDKVTDVDIFAWKDPAYSTTSFFFDKTGVTIGAHTYLPEVGTNASDAFAAQATFGNSYQRIDSTEGGQVPFGSNGTLGRDETSENFNTTFALLPYDPSSGFGPPDPPVGDWQLVGSGAYVTTYSRGHTWGNFNNSWSDDLFLIFSGTTTSAAIIPEVALYSSDNSVPFVDGQSTSSIDCTRGDYDQDGDLDIYVGKNVGTDQIYANWGEQGSYSLSPWPVDSYGVTPVLATSGADMIDTNLDGWPEIFVTNLDGPNQLLDGRFGLTDLLPHTLLHESGTFGSAWCDLNGDRAPDLAFVAPEGIALCLQTGDRQFTLDWLPMPAEGRDIAWADYDNDGDFDFAILCLGSENVIYENLGGGAFGQTTLAHSGADSTTGLSWGDFDNDGRLDLHVTNLDGSNVLWQNQGAGGFAAVEDSLVSLPGRDYGSSWVDIDDDGDLDIYISSLDIPNRLVRNNLTNGRNWIQVAVSGHHWGNQTNLGAIGALVEVESEGVVQQRYIGAQEAGPGHSPALQHFGLGLGPSSVVDRITVHWPFRFPNGSFHSTEMRDVAVNQRIEIEETIYGVSGSDEIPKYTNSLQAAHPNPFNPSTVIGFSLEKESLVSLEIFDVRGRLVRRLVDHADLPSGNHKEEWNGRTESGAMVPSGVYFYRLEAGGFQASRRMVLIK